MLTNSLGDCASLIISVTAVMSSYTEPILTINGNLIPTVIFVTHVWEWKTFPDEWMWEWYCWLMLLKCTFRGFCHVVHKWCCVMIVDLTSFFPSKEFLSVLESLRIAMKASWKLTKIIKGSIISPLSASLGWNCVNLLVFCRRGMAVDAIKICDTWPHVEPSDWPHSPCQASDWPRSGMMAQTRWHGDMTQRVTNMSQHVTEHDINMTGY